MAAGRHTALCDQRPVHGGKLRQTGISNFRARPCSGENSVENCNETQRDHSQDTQGGREVR